MNRRDFLKFSGLASVAKILPLPNIPNTRLGKAGKVEKTGEFLESSLFVPVNSWEALGPLTPPEIMPGKFVV
jgi:hypothetical protein